MKPSADDPRATRAKVGPSLVAATLFALTLFVLVPAHVYLVNRSAVVVFFREVLAVTLGLSVVIGLLLIGLSQLCPPRPRQYITVFVVGVSFLFWIHAYCLVWSYEVMDGGSIPWENYTGRASTDAALWIIVLGLMLKFVPRLYPRVTAICTGLLAIQLVSLGISATRAYVSPLDFFKHYYVEQEPVFEYSTERNVILILLDEFQSDIFAEAVLAQAELRAHFSGFTYFPDTTAGANFTELALPAIMTGRMYDNSVSRDQFLREAYLEHSLPATLRKAGFAVHLYPWRGFANESIYYHESVASNLKRRPRPWQDKLTDVVRLVDMGLFRSMPQFAKQLVHNDSAWLLSDLLARGLSPPLSGSTEASAIPVAKPIEFGPGLTLDNVFTELARGHPLPGQGMTALDGPGVFKFYHLAGLHVPVKMKRDLSPGVFDYNRANFSEQAEAYAKIMGAYLAELRRRNLYDNSMIIIVGDHGSGRSPELYVRPASAEITARLNPTASRGDFQRDKARGIPLLLVKRFGEQGELKTSRVRASVIDIPATVRKELNLPHPPVQAVTGQPDFHGVSLFELDGDSTRPRYYGATRWSGGKSDYVNPIALYRIQGFSWEDEAWSFVETRQPRK
jgi:hypothetical protein